MAVATHLPAGPDTVFVAFEFAAEQYAHRSFIGVPSETARTYHLAAGDLSDGEARAVVTALREGIEDIFVGDFAEDIRERLRSNPKALERELGSQ